MIRIFVTLFNMIISTGVFFIFFGIFIFRAVWGKRAIINSKWKIVISVTYFRNSVAYDHYFWCSCVNDTDDISRWFFLFFFNFLLSGCLVGKRAKNSPKWKITIASVMHHISGTVIHRIMICCQQGKRAKNGPRWQKNSVCCTSCLRNHVSYGCHLWYTFVK